MKIMLPKYIKVGTKKPNNRQLSTVVKKAMAPIVEGEKKKGKTLNLFRTISRLESDLATVERKKATSQINKAIQKRLESMRHRSLRKLVLPQKPAKELCRHRQFNKAMKKSLEPFLTEWVSSGELDPVDCGKIESQINKSMQNPLFQIDQKYLGFIIGKIQKQSQTA